MPQKYGKNLQPLRGFKADPDKIKAVNERIDQRRQKESEKRRFRLFQAEPEELRILEAIEKLPEGVRQDAAEGALIARVARRKKLTLNK